jgi:hypothetical protein
VGLDLGGLVLLGGGLAQLLDLCALVQKLAGDLEVLKPHHFHQRVLYVIVWTVRQQQVQNLYGCVRALQCLLVAWDCGAIQLLEDVLGLLPRPLPQYSVPCIKHF